MTFHESDDDLNQLICTLETIDVGRLKRTSYKKYIDQLYEVTRQSLLADGARLNIIIQHIKTNKGPCFQRDVIIDLIARLVSVDLQAILKKPLARSSSAQWNTLACGIATLPDMIANCNAVEKYPHMEKETFYNQLVEQVYESLEYRSSVTCTVETEYKLFLLKLLGRVAIAGYNLIVWDKFTRRAIYEPRGDVKQFCADVLRLSMKPPAELTALELFIDHLCLPIFSNLKPGRDTGRLITSILATSVLDNEHLRYLICDKSIFRTNYHLTKEKQAIVLFNISSYLASLVTAQQQQSHDNAKDDRMSLILETLLEIVQTWTSPTKILLRTYQQSKYITCAMLVFFRFALQSDGTQLASNANKIQTMIVNAIPIYLNRASHEQRNLACCLCQLILPKLRDILLSKQANVAKSGQNEELKLDFKVDLDDELLYLQRLFDLDVGLLFQDVSDTSIEANNKTTTTSNKLPEIPASAATTSDHVVNDNQVDRHRSGDKQRKSNELNVDGDDNSTTTCCSASNGKVVVDLINRKCSGQGSKVAIDDCHDDDGDDLVPYILSEDEDDDPDGDEFEIGDDATCVPIYLRDCINGLIENNNHRYVRLCLIKVNALINEMIGQQDDADARIESTSVCLAARPGKPSVSWLSTHKDEPDDRLISSRHDHVSSTVNDVGVELARTLLFMENQFGIEKFDEYRMNALVSLCYAAPGLVGKYLISELNGTNRSMRQQLDILNILVCTSHRLAFGSSATMPSEGNMETLANRSQQLIVSSKRTKKAINRFAPYASLFFYGISHRLKADFLDAKSLVISQPQSVMSAFREHQTNDCKTNGARPLDIILKATQQPNATAKIRDTRPSSNATSKSVIVLEDDEDDDWDKKTTTKTDRSLERDSLSDDSYLLSRILMSISNILSCSARQPVTCKLSSDLLDILAAYRCHPDSGVQRGIMSCLKMIRDCTPSTYYNDYIEKRMLRSFGPWLARNESNIQR